VSFKEYYTDVMPKLPKCYGVVAALAAVVQGDRAV
jgi:hypothetical protein